MSERGLMAMALVAFFGYYALPVEDRPWMYYVAQGALILTLALMVWPLMRTRAGRLAATVCVIESAQQAVCGAARWGLSSGGEDLCRQWLGPDYYRAILSLALAAAVTWGMRWQRE